MLGKGLESLIPQKGDPAGSGGADDMTNRPPASEPVATPAVTPALAPDERPVSATAPAPTVFNEPQQVKASEQKPVAPTQASQPSSHESREIESVFHLEVEKIKANPDQPRRTFDEAALRDLAHSIREFGFLQPLVVSKREKETPTGIDVEYELIAGERRFLAAKMLGLRAVPAIIRKVDLEREKLELAVIENIQRENLNPIETARAFQRLQEEFRMTQREIAAKLGKSREAVANAVRLLDLPEYLQVGLQEGKISESHARLLLGIEDPAAQERLYQDIIQNNLTTRDVRDRVEHIPGALHSRRGRPPKTEVRLAPELKAMQESLSSDLGAPVEIEKNAKNGRITITFYSEEELENILRRLGKE